MFPARAWISADVANIRAGNNLRFEILLKARRGQPLTIQEQRFEWYRVELPASAICYIHADFVTQLSQDHSTGVCAANRVNLRAGPSTESTILGQINTGQELSLKERQGDWYLIAPPSQASGWIHSQLVKTEAVQAAVRDPESLDAEAASQSVQASKPTLPLSPSVPEDDASTQARAGSAEAAQVEEAAIDAASTERVDSDAADDAPSPGQREWVGTIKAVPPRLFRIRKARFQLVEESRPLAYLTSSLYNLETFLHHDVVLKGTVDEQRPESLPIIQVYSIKPSIQQ